MTHGILGDQKYEKVIETLLAASPEFSASQEYKDLIGTGDDLPGVVAAAYARFIKRNFHANENSSKELFEPLNNMAEWDDGQVNEMLENEVFEELFDSGSDELTNEMSGTLRERYFRWVKQWELR